jgi:PKD repeat protein
MTHPSRVIALCLALAAACSTDGSTYNAIASGGDGGAVGETGQDGAPTARFTATPQSGAAPLTVVFDASSSSDSDGFVLGYNWVFGDGARLDAGSVSPTHTFESAGTYTVSLVVTDEEGNPSPPASLAITVSPGTSGSGGSGTGGTTATGGTGGTMPPIKPVAGELDSRSIYFIGNSHTDSVKYSSFEQLAQEQGKAHSYGRHMIPGAPLQWIYDHPNDGFCEPHCYPGLSGTSWDVVSLQPYDRHLASDIDHGGKFMDLALQANPNVQMYVYAFFPRTNYPGNAPLSWEEQWLDTDHGHMGDEPINTARAFFEALADGMSAAHPNAPPVLIIPTGEVMYNMKKKIDAGQVPGMSDVWGFYAEDGHLNSIGSYLLAVTFYATIYRADPRVLSIGQYSVSSDIASLIRDTAYQTVGSYAYSGVKYE